MLKKVFMCFVALLAIAAAAAGPVRGQTTYNVTFGGFAEPAVNTTVSVASLPQTINFYPFAVISNGSEFISANVTSGGNGKVSVDAGWNQMSITISGTFEGTATIHVVCSDPQENPVSSDITVACTLPPVPITVRMAAGTEDAANWTLASGDASVPGNQVLEGIMSGSTLTATYVGDLKVKEVIATKHQEPIPLTIEALTAGTIVVQQPQSGMQYTLNGGAKTAMTESPTEITVAVGDKVAFYGNGTNITIYEGTRIAGGTADVKVYGNIMSLVNEEHFDTATTLTTDYQFYNLFRNNVLLKDASGLMLPATTLTRACYSSMFNGCTSLTTAPALPATTLAQNCYYGMFNGCAALTTAPALPATTLAKSCYSGMFDGCAALTTAPALPATELAQSCYSVMFRGCAALTTAPALPATTLANDCYSYMFYNCTSLTTAPELPAQTLVSSCYKSMFYNCRNLSSVTCLATSGINQNSSTDNWLKDAGSDVTSTKTFYAASSANWPTNSVNGIPEGWTRQNIDN